jgi:hypothetical protein
MDIDADIDAGDETMIKQHVHWQAWVAVVNLDPVTECRITLA